MKLGLALKQDWIKPYESPEIQLSTSYRESEKALTGQTQQ
jgi:hypothetical protein